MAFITAHSMYTIHRDRQKGKMGMLKQYRVFSKVSTLPQNSMCLWLLFAYVNSSKYLQV